MALTIYNFHPVTGEFVGSSAADPSPREQGVWLVPAYATQTAPPAKPEGEAVVFKDGQWTTIPDYRGETWWYQGKEAIVSFIGEPEASDGWTNIAPPQAGENQAVQWGQGGWEILADHRGETWWDGTVSVRIDFLGDPVERGLSTVPVPPAEPAPGPKTSADVNLARDTRINAGVVFNGVLYQTRPEDRENIQGAYSRAQSAVLIGGALPGDFSWHGGPGDFEWIAADDSRVKMDAQTMMSFGEAVLDHKAAHIFAANAIKAMDPIPDDFDEVAAYWP